MPELASLIVMELEANEVPHEMIYVDEAGFNLAKRCWGGKKHNWHKGHSYRAGPKRSQLHRQRRCQKVHLGHDCVEEGGVTDGVKGCTQVEEEEDG